MHIIALQVQRYASSGGYIPTLVEAFKKEDEAGLRARITEHREQLLLDKNVRRPMGELGPVQTEPSPENTRNIPSHKRNAIENTISSA